MDKLDEWLKCGWKASCWFFSVLGCGSFWKGRDDAVRVCICMKKVLVVDDQTDCSEPMARLLGLCGFEAGIAGDGRAALGMLEAFGPDLVLLDLAMPGMDGFDF